MLIDHASKLIMLTAFCTYIQDILSSKNVSSMSYFVKGIIKERKIEMKNLLREIGRIIKQFTGHECRKLYTDLDYVYEPDGGESTPVNFEHNKFLSIILFSIVLQHLLLA